MLIYILLVLYIVIIAKFMCKNNQKNSKFLIFAFIPIILISSFRSATVGIDTKAYVSFYNWISTKNLDCINYSPFEVGFTIFCKILSVINNDYSFLLIMSSLIINISVLNFIKKYSNNYLSSVLCYIFINYYFMYMNIMRQGLALAIILIAIDSLFENKNFKFLVLIALASTFHSSALICLSFYFLKNIKVTKKSFIIIIPLLIVIFIFGERIFDLLINISTNFIGKYEAYADSEIFRNDNYFGALILFSFHLFIFTLPFILNIKIENNELLSKIKPFLLVGSMMSMLAMRNVVMNRLYSYFLIFEIIWIPQIISYKQKNKKFSKILVYSILVVFWLVIMIYRPEWYGVVPYSFNI